MLNWNPNKKDPLVIITIPQYKLYHVDPELQQTELRFMCLITFHVIYALINA